MNQSLTATKVRTVLLLAVCALILACGISNAATVNSGTCAADHGNWAPRSMVGMDVNLQIENTKSNLAGGFPTQGVVVKQYKKDGTWLEQGSGGASHQPAHGSYLYKRTGPRTAVDKSIDESMNNAVALVTYTFDSPCSGLWVANWSDGVITFSGKFTVVPSEPTPDQDLAPATIAGLHIALTWNEAVSTTLPPDSFPKRGLAVQTYNNDGSMRIAGFGAKTLNSHGTFHYKKMSANTAVEETTQISDIFTLPYTMVYTFKTPTSGVWFQNLGDGYIRFTGTFETFVQ